MRAPSRRRLLLVAALFLGVLYLGAPFWVFYFLSQQQAILLQREVWPELEREARRTAEVAALAVTDRLLDDARQVARSEARRLVDYAAEAAQAPIPAAPTSARREPTRNLPPDPSNVSHLNPGEMQRLSLELNTDAWLRFQVPAAADYVIDVVGFADEQGRYFDPYLYLYLYRGDDQSLTLLAIDDDGGDEPLASRLVRQLDANVVYFVQIEEYAGLAGACTISINQNLG